MYTVIRVTGQPEQFDVVHAILEDITRARPDVATERRRRDGSVVCDISRDSFWWEHQRAIVRFIEDCSRSIEMAAKHDVCVSIDVAIDSTDVAPHPYFSIYSDVEFMKVLTEHGVALEFTMYGCWQDTPSTDVQEPDSPLMNDATGGTEPGGHRC